MFVNLSSVLEFNQISNIPRIILYSGEIVWFLAKMNYKFGVKLEHSHLLQHIFIFTRRLNWGDNEIPTPNESNFTLPHVTWINWAAMSNRQLPRYILVINTRLVQLIIINYDSNTNDEWPTTLFSAVIKTRFVITTQQNCRSGGSLTAPSPHYVPPGFGAILVPSCVPQAYVSVSNLVLRAGRHTTIDIDGECTSCTRWTWFHLTTSLDCVTYVRDLFHVWLWVCSLNFFPTPKNFSHKQYLLIKFMCFKTCLTLNTSDRGFILKYISSHCRSWGPNDSVNYF